MALLVSLQAEICNAIGGPALLARGTDVFKDSPVIEA